MLLAPLAKKLSIFSRSLAEYKKTTSLSEVQEWIRKCCR